MKKKTAEKIEKKIHNFLNLFVKKKQKKSKKKSEKKSEKKVKKSFLKKFLKNIFFLGIIFSFLSIGIFLIWAASLTIPNIETIAKLKAAQSTKIYDNTGEILLYNIYEDESRTSIPLDKISPNFLNALISIEDKDFYSHNGIKINSIIKAAYITLIEKGNRGASTITQQVVKNTLLTNEKSIERKMKEIILAYKLEKIWTKEEILGLYVNEIPFAGVLYGIEEAALYYFGKNAADLTLGESAYLAAMLPKPSYFKNNKKEWTERKDIVLELMLEQDLIDKKEYEIARREEVSFLFKSSRSGIKAPHFVFYVIEELEKKYGKDALRQDGMKIISTLDFNLQQKMQEIVETKVKLNQEEYGVENASAVAIESNTGSILAMVGSRDYFDEKIDGKVNIALAKRQPGSAFKPVVYLSAFQEGYTPDTVLWDVDTEFNLKCPTSAEEIIEKVFEENNSEKVTEEIQEKVQKYLEEGIYIDKRGDEIKCYRPRNFDWNTANPFKGPIKMKNALPESRNIPAIKTLYLVGIKKALENAKLFGIKSLNLSENHYGLGLVLGGGEVQLLNLTSTYSTFSNDGIRIEPNGVLEIFDSNKNSIYKKEIERKRVIDSKYVQNLNEILADNSLKYPTFGYNSILYFDDRQVASKTGTTNDNRDSWTIGYDSGNVSVGVWVGNNDNRSAIKNPGRAITYEIWRESIEEALKDYPVVEFEKAPELSESSKAALRGVLKGGSTISIDTKTGNLATAQTPKQFIKEILIPSYHSILHWVDKKDPTGEIPQNKDQAYSHWEKGIQVWTSQNYDEVKKDISSIISDISKILKNSSN